MNEILFRNVMLYDGSGQKPFCADVGVRDDKIVKTAPGGTLSAGAAKIVEGKELALTPGFVDVHTHSDGRVGSVPWCDSFISQGVTTDISGNCGFSSCLTERTPMTFAEYAAEIDSLHPGINMAHLCGHNSLRIRVMGFEDRSPSAEELSQMKALLAEALSAGAAGFSAGLFYLPGQFAATEELQNLAALLKGTGKPYATHIRSEAETLLESVEEAISIAASGDNNLQISHLKTSGPASWHKLTAVLERIEEAQRQGMDLLCDRYAYIHSGTTLRVVLPEPFDKVDTHTLCTKLKNSSSFREELLCVLRKKGAKRDLSRALIMHSPVKEHAQYYGKSVTQIASEKGMTEEEMLVDLLASGVSPTTAFGTMCEENLHRILSKEYVISGSDGFICSFDDGATHPRSFGNFPSFYRIAVQHSSPEKVIHRMTSLPARKFNLSGRGMIRKDFYADLVLLDLDHFESSASYGNPNRICSGVKQVYVNGILSFAEGQCVRTNPRSGRFLRIK